MRIIIAGNRTFSDYQFIENKCVEIVSREQYDLEIPCSEIEIVSGHAKGADACGERFAKKFKLTVKEFSAKWDDLDAYPMYMKTDANGRPYNMLAGSNRNTEMAEYASENGQGMLIAFPIKGEKNSGTLDMLKKGKNAGLKVFKIVYNKETKDEYNKTNRLASKLQQTPLI